MSVEGESAGLTIEEQLDGGSALSVEDGEEGASRASDEGPRKRSRKKPKSIEDKERSTGIVYLSRIPPFMKPRKVRHLLSQFGDVGRIYLQPEGIAHHCTLQLCDRIALYL